MRRPAIWTFAGMAAFACGLGFVGAQEPVSSSPAPTSEPRPRSPLSVRDFGAADDGIADDTQALQATVDAALKGADPAKKVRNAIAAVYLPAGTYKITSPIVIRSVSQISFYGDGLGLTLLAASAGDCTVRSPSGPQEIKTAAFVFAAKAGIPLLFCSTRVSPDYRVFTKIVRSSSQNASEALESFVKFLEAEAAET